VHNSEVFLRCTRRVKDGKEHRYWSIVENRRGASQRVVQRQVLYLGEINDSQKAAWCRCIEVFDEPGGHWHQVMLFPEDREAPDLAQQAVQCAFVRAASVAAPAVGRVLVERCLVGAIAAG